MLKIKPELFKSTPAPGCLLSHSELLYYIYSNKKAGELRPPA